MLCHGVQLLVFVMEEICENFQREKNRVARTFALCHGKRMEGKIIFYVEKKGRKKKRERKHLHTVRKHT